MLLHILLVDGLLILLVRPSSLPIPVENSSHRVVAQASVPRYLADSDLMDSEVVDHVNSLSMTNFFVDLVTRCLLFTLIIHF